MFYDLFVKLHSKNKEKKLISDDFWISFIQKDDTMNNSIEELKQKAEWFLKCQK